MRIRDRPEFRNKPAPVVMGAADLVATAVAVMASRNIGSVVIAGADRKVTGIVTERDMLRRLLGAKLDPETTPLSAIMTSEVRTASPDDDVVDWLRQMSNERFRHVPVVDADGVLLTVMSQGDFVSYTWPELLTNLRLKTVETIGGRAGQAPMLVGAIMIYTLLMIVVFRLI